MSDSALATKAPDDSAALVPTSSIDRAIEAATQLGKEGVEVLRELYAIERARRADFARDAYFRAMADLHARLGSIQKNRTARFLTKSGAPVEYRFADLHAIASALRKHTGSLGLAWRWENKVERDAVTVTCVVSHRDGHSESSPWVAPIEGNNPLTSAPQKVKVATTFGERVSLIAAFGLTDTEDDVDGADVHPLRAGADGDGPVEAVTAEQVANIQALLDEIGTDKDGKRLCAYLGVPRLSDIPAAEFPRVIGLLEDKRKAGR